MLGGDSPKGLHRTAELDAHHYPFLRAKALATTNPLQFQEEHFYTFGWSGKATLEGRKEASRNLFSELKQLDNIYQEKYGCSPELNFISHSHGGNVILHLAEINDLDNFTLNISKTILLACPVQKHTNHLIQSDIFKRVYSLHSHTDMIQIVDPQGLHDRKNLTKPLLSVRHFDPHPKLAQALIRWKEYPLWTNEDLCIKGIAMQGLIKAINSLNYLKKGRGLFHVEFGLLPFVRQIPTIIDQLDALFENCSNCPAHKDHDIVIEL